MRDELGTTSGELLRHLGTKVSGLELSDVLRGEDVVLQVVEGDHDLRGVRMAELGLEVTDHMVLEELRSEHQVIDLVLGNEREAHVTGVLDRVRETERVADGRGGLLDRELVIRVRADCGEGALHLFLER